jgi:hypothetical protein
MWEIENGFNLVSNLLISYGGSNTPRLSQSIGAPPLMMTWLGDRWRKFHVWDHAFWLWFREARLVWFALAAVAIGIAWIIAFPEDFYIRVVGMLLQLLGIGTIVRDFAKLYVRWIRSIPVPGQQGRTVSGGATLPMPTISGRARSKPSGASIQDQIDAVEKEIDAVLGEVDQMKRGIKAKSTEIKQEAVERGNGDAEVMRQMARSEARTLSLAAGGSILLAVGVVMTSLPNEIVCVLRWLLNK